MRPHGRVLTIAMFLIATANATTLYTAPQTFDTGLKRTSNVQFTNLTFAEFDPTLGTLTSVHLQLAGYAEAGYSYLDLSGDTNHFQFTASVTVKLANPSDPSSPLAIIIPTLSDSPRAVAALGTYSTPGFTNVPIVRSLTGTNSTADIVYTAPSILTLFQGPGTINLPVSGSIRWNFEADGDAQTGISSRYIGTATLFYDYTPADTPTPEPGTFALLLGGLGLLGVGILRRHS